MRNDDKITRYFLGELSTDETEQFDRECFSNSTFAESVFVVEDELIDRYVRNELSNADRERFEQFYLTTDARRSRVAMATNLKVTMNSATTEKARPVESHNIWQRVIPNRALTRYAFATLTLALVVIAVWLLIRNSNKEQVAKTNPPINVASPENSPTPSSSPSSPTPAPTGTPVGQEPASQLATVVYTLVPGTQRDAGERDRVIKLSPQTKTVELRLIIQDQVHPPYEVRLATVEGESVFVRRGLRTVAVNGGQAVSVRVPASLFEARDYVGRIVGRTGDAAPSYTFRVTKTK